MITAYKVGGKGFYDTFAGLVPCKVEALESDNCVAVIVTKDTGPYKKGERLKPFAHMVIPPKQLRKTQFSWRINPNFKWVNV